MSNVSEKIVDVITMLTDNAIQKAGYDKTIQAQIISCEDATIGKYKCRYQDMIIYAYGSPDTMLNSGSYVYILVPNGDMKKEKTILGTNKKLGINYISQAEGDQAYDIIGNNCIGLNKTFYLDSANKNYKYLLYKHGEVNEIGLDLISLEQYIYQSSSLIIGAVFKTSIPPIRQYRGHYGITYKLRFLDNTSNQEVIRSYTLDEDNMVDNPYRLVYGTRQYQIFNVDGPNFIRVESIEIFNQDFPEATGTVTDEKLSTGDIEISSLELSGANRMPEGEITGVAISFFTPQGTFFTDSSTATSYKTITAQVRIKGKLVSAAQSIPFYWGTEHVGISPSSEYYNKYLGRGWKCLNNKNVISEGTETSDPVVQWVPGNDTYIFNFNNATARDNKIKVAIVYDGNVITKTINIQNLSAQTPVLTIQSNKGTKFYYDIGHPTLTCKATVNGQELRNCTYYWAYESNTGVFEELPDTTEQNTAYEAAVAALESLRTEITRGTKFVNAETENLTDLETAVKAFNFIQRVKENKIYDVQINRITSFGTFKCSVYNGNNIYLGTASITLTNTLNGEDTYSLVINNGSVVFQYNENGVAPNNKSLDVQQAIQGLSFTIYDNLGESLDSSVIANDKNCKIRWEFPIKETLLVDQQQNGTSSGTDATQTYKYYDNKTNLVYNISQKYDIRKQRNQIKLTVDYKGMSLTAKTDFMFTKQGQPGTNGTEYIVKLVPNTKMNNPPLWPMITKAGSDYILNYGLGSLESQTVIGVNTGNSYKLFKAQLWHSGELVWEGTEADPQKASVSDGITYPTLVHWDILRNQYNRNTQDASAFVVENSTGNITYTGDHLQSAIATPLANIIKCSITVQGKTYYGTIPITTAWTLNNNYRVNLKDYTGFRYAIYTSDGILPQYDNSHPFEFICKEKINDVWEDVSLVEGNHAITYTLSTIGNYLSTKDGSATNSNLLQILRSEVYRDGCEKNQWIARPAARYDGVCINEAICCIYRQNNQIIGRINVPIHYLLNKFGLSHINEWDGNSIQINEQGGFILSPQMGAGQKDSNNRFTGVLMGEVRTAEKAASDVGLLGYSQGDRTFFLNSKNGSALFGKSNKGQIVIDPNQDRALLYSGNFWKNYNEDGLPTNYTATNENKAGLLIDLTTPQIRYGNGKFSLNENGKLNAQDVHVKGEIIASSLQLTDGATIGTADIDGLDQELSAYAKKNAAVAEQHIIYKTQSSAYDTATTITKPSVWVTNQADSQNAWTLKRPTYNKSYPNIFIAMQKKFVDGTISCSTPLKDDALTIIDGGRITTGTIDASKATISNINASNITTGELNANLIKSGKIQSSNGRVYFDLNNNIIACSQLVSADDPNPYIDYPTTIAKVGSFQHIIAQEGNSTTYRTIIGMGIYNTDYPKNILTISPSKNADDPDRIASAYNGLSVGANDAGMQVTKQGYVGLYGWYGYPFLPSSWIEDQDKATGYSYQGIIIVEPKFIKQNGVQRSAGKIHLRGAVDCNSTIEATNIVSPNAKSRVLNTDNYQNRLLYCYEMPSPMFGDIGEGKTDNLGVCYVDIDDIFSETICNNIEYQVFLQKQGQGDLWVDEKNIRYFIVRGTPNTKFAWELKIKQRDYETERFQLYDKNIENIDTNVLSSLIEEEALIDLENYISEMEKEIYETTQQLYGA